MSSQTTLTGSCDSSSSLRNKYTDEQWNAYANQHSDYGGQLGNGRDIPTVLESDGAERSSVLSLSDKSDSDGGEERCPWCGEWYSKIGSHWSRSDCNYPPISQYKIKLLKGMCLGDGSVCTDKTNPRIEIGMVNKTFLKWLQEKLTWMSGKLSMHRTALESVNHNRKRGFHSDAKVKNYTDMYRFRTKIHPQLQQFSDWYHENAGISFPKNLTVSPIELKIWYISDGNINWANKNSSVILTSRNESDTPNSIIGSLKDHGFTVGKSSTNFRLSTNDTEDFFDLIGDPVPGFEYKWAWQDRDRYKHLKEQCREKHCTQTFE